MFVLEFGVSKSNKYHLAIDLAKTFDKFRPAYLEKPNRIILLPSEIKHELDRLKKLLSIIANWKNVNATFLSNKVDPYKFVYHNIEIHECHNSREISVIKDRYCTIWLESWGCKFLRTPVRHWTKWVNYKGLKFWYNSGQPHQNNFPFIFLINRIRIFVA